MPSSACEIVFGIPELLSQIILSLPSGDILFTAREVNQHWRILVDTTPSIRWKTCRWPQSSVGYSEPVANVELCPILHKESFTMRIAKTVIPPPPVLPRAESPPPRRNRFWRAFGTAPKLAHSPLNISEPFRYSYAFVPSFKLSLCNEVDVPRELLDSICCTQPPTRIVLIRCDDQEVILRAPENQTGVTIGAIVDEFVKAFLRAPWSLKDCTKNIKIIGSTEFASLHVTDQDIVLVGYFPGVRLWKKDIVTFTTDKPSAELWRRY